MAVNETHDPVLRSWVDSANVADSDFPIQNLPLGIIYGADGEPARGAVAIGDQALDLALALKSGCLGAYGQEATRALELASESTLNALMASGPSSANALRLALSRALRVGSKQREPLQACLRPQAPQSMALPARIGDYTDFYTGIHHATAVGRLFRPDAPLLPNYKWVPIGYHGRSSSIRVSGQQFERPVGQRLPPGATVPLLGPSERLDYELELGAFIARGNELGRSIPIESAETHIFGLCLLNDWSARDLQAWEYQPLGPFLAKNFASTISPWIVTLEALEPYRVAWTRRSADPQPLPYLDSAILRARGALDIQLEVLLQTEAMRDAGTAPVRLSQ